MELTHGACMVELIKVSHGAEHVRLLPTAHSKRLGLAAAATNVQLPAFGNCVHILVMGSVCLAYGHACMMDLLCKECLPDKILEDLDE